MQYNEHIYDWLVFLFRLNAASGEEYKKFLKAKGYVEWM